MKILGIKFWVLVIILSISSCASNNNNNSEEKLFPSPTYETNILIGGIQDSIEVESKQTFTLQVSRENYDGNFELTVDTIVPVYTFNDWIDWDKVPDNSYIIPPEAVLNIERKGVELFLDNNPLESEMPIQANRKYNFTFANPQVIGEYKILLKIQDQEQNEFKKEIKIKVYSPDILIKVYNVDPWLDLGIYDKNFYEELNGNYSFNPLSEVFSGTETDTFRTYESLKPGYPGQFTYPGIGITVYFQQKGAKEFVYKLTQLQGAQSAFLPRWDNDVKHGAETYAQYSGFHCFELLTWSDDISAGTYQYEICLTDHWGKTQTQKITLLAIAY